MAPRNADGLEIRAEPRAPARDGLADRLWRVALRCAYRVQLAVWYVLRPRIHGAYVAVWHGERVLVIRNSYRRGFSFPAGRLRRGEEPAEAAARELVEEVGIDVPCGALRAAGVIVDDSSGAVDHAHIFELHCAEEPALRVDGREVVWAAFLLPERALERPLVNVVRSYLSRSTRP